MNQTPTVMVAPKGASASANMYQVRIPIKEKQQAVPEKHAPSSFTPWRRVRYITTADRSVKVQLSSRQISSMMLPALSLHNLSQIVTRFLLGYFLQESMSLGKKSNVEKLMLSSI